MLPSDGIFSSEGSSGTVAPSSTLSLILHFTPTRPIAYHKKLVCLVHLLSHPLYIDLIGTAFTETTKPGCVAGTVVMYVIPYINSCYTEQTFITLHYKSRNGIIKIFPRGNYIT